MLKPNYKTSEERFKEALLKLLLRESDEGDRYTTLDVISGLHGVCLSLDWEAASNGCSDVNHVADLSMAARVLSTTLRDRIEI